MAAHRSAPRRRQALPCRRRQRGRRSWHARSPPGSPICAPWSTQACRPPTAAGQIGFALATDTDFFLSLAKFRALRRLWGQVLEVAGASSAMPSLRVHAETAERMFTRVDPHVNILRGTVAAFAAAAGGAGSITVLPFDHALGMPTPLARRIARNTQLVLLEEAQLGRVLDPAGGSWFVERLTEELATKAWSLVQEVERRGGMLAALRQGWPQERVAASRKRLEADIASRRQPITGVSEFADLREPSATDPVAGAGRRRDARRPADPHASASPRASSACGRAATPSWLGPASGRASSCARWAARTSSPPAPRSPATCSRPAASRRWPAIPCRRSRISATPFAPAAPGRPRSARATPTMPTSAEAAARALKHAHAARVYLMGRPDETQRAAWQAAGVDEFVHAGADVLATLERTLAAEAGEAA